MTPAPSGSDARRLLLVLLAIAALIGLPAAIVGGMKWLDLSNAWSSASRPLPKWVTAGEVRATTQDGSLVKLRVALDVTDSSTQSAVQRRLSDVAVLCELSIAARSTQELAGPDGIERLSADILGRINVHLAKEGVAPARSVAIQDLWYMRAP